MEGVCNEPALGGRAAAVAVNLMAGRAPRVLRACCAALRARPTHRPARRPPVRPRHPPHRLLLCVCVVVVAWLTLQQLHMPAPGCQSATLGVESCATTVVLCASLAGASVDSLALTSTSTNLVHLPPYLLQCAAHLAPCGGANGACCVQPQCACNTNGPNVGTCNANWSC